jgi:predicted small lipoprotein YifL
MKPAAATVLFVSLALAGCGLKGPLYLPEKPGEVVIRGPQQEEAATETGTESGTAGEGAATAPEPAQPPKQP